MINVPKYNKNNRKQTYDQLPKGAYVCKIMNIQERDNKHGHPMVVISFDIAEGPFKDFYAKQYQSNSSEDKKWNYDAITYLTIPFEGCDTYILQSWDTFWADVEDSNNGYVFTGDEQSVVGKTFGGVFRIEQSESNGNIYDHTRLAWTRVAQDIRDGKVKKLPQDKLVKVTTTTPTDDDGFIVPGSPEDLPWG